MFSYYGSKSKIVQYYPSPTCDKIIEPFAGSARYSLRYFDKDILLVDKYKVIVDVWHYLQLASQKDILGLPKIDIDFDLSKHFYLSEVEKNLIGFLIADAQSTPSKKLTKKWFSLRPTKIEHRIKGLIDLLPKIKHWKIIQGSYEDLENENATWFIDPPYQFGGEHYKESNKNIDYNSLANWCKSRKGQIIVCENTNSNWMEFTPIVRMKGANKFSTEAIWTNFKTQYGSIQQDLFGRGNKKECVNVA